MLVTQNFVRLGDDGVWVLGILRTVILSFCWVPMRRRYQGLQGHKLLVLHEILLSCHEWSVRLMSLLAAMVATLHVSDTSNVFLAISPHRLAVPMHT